MGEEYQVLERGREGFGEEYSVEKRERGSNIFLPVISRLSGRISIWEEGKETENMGKKSRLKKVGVWI